MRVLLVSNKYPPAVVGGAEVLVETLAASLVSHGHEVAVLTSRPEKGPMTRRVRRGAVIHEVWPGTSIIPPRDLPRWRELLAQVPVHLLDLHNPSVERAAEDIIGSFSPHVVHTHNLYGLSLAPWAAARRGGIPVVHTSHDCHLICPKGILRHDERVIRQAGRITSEAYRRRYMSRTALVDVFCAPTTSHAELHRRHGCRAREFEVVPNSLFEMPPPPAPREQRRGGPLGVLFLGQLERHKGIDVLLEALRLLPPGAVHCDIAGKGSREGAVREFAQRRGGLTHLGFVRGEEKERLFRAADLLVFPSLCLESFGLAVSEALWHGVPAAVTRAGGQGELVREGETGFLFPPGDGESLASLLHRLSRNPASLAAMGDRGREEAGRYLAGDMAIRYEKIFSRLLKGREGSCLPKATAGGRCFQ